MPFRPIILNGEYTTWHLQILIQYINVINEFVFLTTNLLIYFDSKNQFIRVYVYVISSLKCAFNMYAINILFQTNIDLRLIKSDISIVNENIAQIKSSER